MRTHPHTHTEKTQGVLRQGPVNPSEAEVCHGTGQCQSPWTRGVGWFHGTLDINAPPRLEVNNSAHSITCTGMCPHTHTHTFTPPSPLHSEYGVIWMVGSGNHLLMCNGEVSVHTPEFHRTARSHISIVIFSTSFVSPCTAAASPSPLAKYCDPHYCSVIHS